MKAGLFQITGGVSLLALGFAAGRCSRQTEATALASPVIRPRASPVSAGAPGVPRLTPTGARGAVSLNSDWPRLTGPERQSQLEHILKMANAEERLAEFLVRVRDFTAEDITAAIGLIKAGDREGLTFAREWELLVSHWGRLHGGDGFDSGMSAFQIKPEAQDWFTKGALKGWSEKDPQAAVAWLNDHPGHTDWPGCLNSVITGIGHTDPQQAAATLANSLPVSHPKDDWVREAALKSLTEGVVATQGLTGLRQWLASIPTDADAGATKQRAFFHVAFRLGHAGGDQARAFLEAHAGKSWRADRAYAEYTKKLGRSAPEAALTWAMSLPVGSQGVHPGTAQTYQQWHGRDPARAEAWLGAQKDPALVTELSPTQSAH
jgi:hypothetical protein